MGQASKLAEQQQGTYKLRTTKHMKRLSWSAVAEVKVTASMVAAGTQ